MGFTRKTLPGMGEVEDPAATKNSGSKKDVGKKNKRPTSPVLGKAIKLQTPDFNDPYRRKTCLEVDYPIVAINTLAGLEATSGAAKKPIYQMSKWWARRQSSVFRSLLIAAATQAPEDETQAAKLVWDTYYSSHQKAENFSGLRVLDPFMGGGTTVVEGIRLGFQVTGVDLNPVAWFIVKNEVANIDLESVQEYFAIVERELKPQIQPFYATTCPRGHLGRWFSVKTGRAIDIDPLELTPSERHEYRWDGPEIIYTFWAKHGQCQRHNCNHRTPVFANLGIANKKLSTYRIALDCPYCNHEFHAELGETRIAPGAERVVLDSEPSFTEMSQLFGRLLKDYNKGNSGVKRNRIEKLLGLVEQEPGLFCPNCGHYAGQKVHDALKKQSMARRASDINKKVFGIERYKVHMHLLVHPIWLTGTNAVSEHGLELGGYAGASPDATGKWNQLRQKNLYHIEVRGKSLPDSFYLADGTEIVYENGTVPSNGNFTCSSCGLQQSNVEASEKSGHTAPIAAYALQCYCPTCDDGKYQYGGRFFKILDDQDILALNRVEHEWASRRKNDLGGYWPLNEIQFSRRTHQKEPLPKHGYTHWWKMYNSRQLLVHALLLREITNGEGNIEAKEQVLGAFQQYLRSQSMFSFYHVKNDQIAAALSNPNFNPKPLVIETCVFSNIGSGRWGAYVGNVLKGLEWKELPRDPIVDSKNASVEMADSPISNNSDIYCASSTDLSFLEEGARFDFIITDPPFGDNVNYADLADFFYVWLRIPFSRWYLGKTEATYFAPSRTPHSMEAIENPAEHPDDREAWEKTKLITKQNLPSIRQMTGNQTLQAHESNPLYRPEPAPEFYRQTLTACWNEAGRYLKPGGILAFTFHHSEDEPWLDVLESLFSSGYILVATYPIRSDETKGENAQFGSQKIEYDIIHVCRKRLEEPEPVSWSQMRRWVKKEAQRLKELLEISHGQDLLEPDMLVILRGKALEFYSRHYGQVYTGDDEILGVRDALLGINQLLEDAIRGDTENGHRRPPDSAEPATRFYLRLFQADNEMERDELHKTLRGTGITSDDLEARGWITVAGTIVKAVPIKERYAYFTTPGRNRKVLRTDLDQAHFLIGAALPGSGLDITQELNRHTFALKNSVDDILEWYAQTAITENIREAAQLANNLVAHWRAQPQAQPAPQQMSLFERLEAEE